MDTLTGCKVLKQHFPPNLCLTQSSTIPLNLLCASTFGLECCPKNDQLLNGPLWYLSGQRAWASFMAGKLETFFYKFSYWWCNKGSRIRSWEVTVLCLLPQTRGILPMNMCITHILATTTQTAVYEAMCSATASWYVYNSMHTPISNYVTRLCKGRTVSVELNHHHCWRQLKLVLINNYKRFFSGASSVVQSRSFIR